jgi:hypothetical protein
MASAGRKHKIGSLVQRAASMGVNLAALAGAPPGIVLAVSLGPNVLILHRELTRAKGLLAFCASLEVPKGCDTAVQAMFAEAVTALRTRVNNLKKLYSKKFIKAILQRGSTGLQTLNVDVNKMGPEAQGLLSALDDERVEDGKVAPPGRDEADFGFMGEEELDDDRDDDDDDDDATDDEDDDASSVASSASRVSTSSSPTHFGSLEAFARGNKVELPVSKFDAKRAGADRTPSPFKRMRKVLSAVLSKGKEKIIDAVEKVEFGLDVKASIFDLQVDMNRVSTLIAQFSYVNSGKKACMDYVWAPIHTKFRKR